jgi:hypothetical protein
VFKKFFGKKNDGFYLQLEDEDASSKPQAKDQAPAKPEPVVTPLPPAAVVTTAPVATATTTAPATVVPAATAPPTVTKAEKKLAEAEKKAAKAEKKSAKKAEDPKVTAAPTPVVSAPAAPPITNFATDYLIKPSSSSGRRLPGANMKGFLDLARQVEKPKAFKATAAERKPSEK